MPLGAARFGLLGGVADLGKLELIETKTISSASSAIFTSIDESTYNVHFLTINNVINSDLFSNLRLRFFESGVEESASVYQEAIQYGYIGVGFGESRTTAQDYLKCTFDSGNATNETSCNYTYFYNLGDSSKYSFTTSQHNTMANAGNLIMGFGSGVLPQASTVDQIKLFVTSGTFSATASLYGIAES